MALSRWLLFACLFLGGIPPVLADEAIPLPLAAVTGAAGPAIVRPVDRVPDRPVPDPFPIRRVFAPTERLTAALPQLHPGPIVRLPRTEFESRVRSASQHLNAPAPRLLEARYRATFVDGGLKGEADWRLFTNIDGQLFPLEPFKAAVRLAARTEQTGVKLVTSKAGGPTIAIPQAGDNAVSLDWSIRGTDEPTVDRIEFTAPPSPIATLELNLPSDRSPTLPGFSHLLTGPFPTTDPTRKLWTIAFGGQSRLDLAIRKPRQENGTRSKLRLNRKSLFELAPGLVTTTVELAMDPGQVFPSEFTLECDSRFRVSAVNGTNPLTWRTDTTSTPNPATTRIIVSHTETGLAKIVLTGFCALPSDAFNGWATPQISMVGSLLGGDAMTVVCNTELKWLGADLGDYRVTSAYEEQGYHVSLTSSMLPHDGVPDRRPVKLRVRSAAVDFVTQEELTWQIGIRPKLTAKIRVRVTQGLLQKLRVVMPVGYTYVSASMVPEDLGLTVSPVAKQPQALSIEPTNPIANGQSFDLILDMQASADESFARPHDIAFPDLQVPGTQERDGLLTVMLPVGIQAWSPLTPTSRGEDGKRIRYLYRAECLTGSLIVSSDATLEPRTDREPTPKAVRVQPESDRSGGRNSRWEFAGLERTTRIEADGEFRVALTGRIQQAADRTMPITLPHSAELVSMTIAGLLVEPIAIPPDSTNPEPRYSITLPNISANGLTFELRYRLRNANHTFGPLLIRTRNDAEVPTTDRIETRWSVVPEYRRWPRFDSPVDAMPTDGSRLLVLPTSLLRSIGLVFGVLLAWFGGYLVLKPASVRRSWSYLLLVGIIGSGLWLLPEGWHILLRPAVFTGMICSTILVVARPLNRVTVTAVSLSNSTTSNVNLARQQTGPSSSIILGILLFTWSAHSAVLPDPVTVLVTPADDKRFDVIVSQSTLDQLDQLSKSATPELTITAAEYEGTCDTKKATITAKYTIVAQRAGDQRFVLPLGGVRLESLALDGQTAFADATKADQYTIPIRTSGTHTLTVQFVVPVHSVDADQEILFKIPDHVSTRVNILGPQAVSLIDCPTRHGIQIAKTEANGLRLLIDHGSGNTLHIRWRDQANTLAKATLDVWEAHVWDLSESDMTLNSAFQFSAEKGAVSSVTIEVPAGLEVTRPIGRTGDGSILTPRGTGLRNWKRVPQADGSQHVVIEFQSPMTGRFTVLLKLLPQHAANAHPVLRTPHALNVRQAEAYLALRLRGLTMENVERVQAIDYPTDELLRRFGMIPELVLDRSATDRVFQRTGESPELKPHLRRAEEIGTTSAEGRWTIGQHVDFDGQIQFSRSAMVSEFEFEWSSHARIQELRSQGLLTWSQTGNRVQVWFRKPTREAMIRWTSKLDPKPNIKPLTTSHEVDLPLAHGLPANTNRTVRIHPRIGWTSKVLPTNGIAAKVSPSNADDLVALDASTAMLRVLIGSPRAFADPELAESVERVNESMRYKAIMTTTILPGAATHFGVRLDGIPNTVVPEVQISPNASMVSLDTTQDVRTWLVQVPAVTTDTEVVITLTVNKLPIGLLPEPHLFSGGKPHDLADRTLSVGPALVITNGPSGWQTGQIEGTNAWRTRNSGRWFLAAAAVPQTPLLVTNGMPSTPIPIVEAAPPMMTSFVLTRAIPAFAWVAAMCLLAWLTQRPWARWPDRLFAWSLLAACTIGVSTFAGVLFDLAAVVAIVARSVGLIRRISAAARR